MCVYVMLIMQWCLYDGLVYDDLVIIWTKAIVSMDFYHIMQKGVVFFLCRLHSLDMLVFT